MGDAPSPPDQPLPEWMTWSLVTNAEGNEEYTIISLPLTYYGPPIPLGTDGSWTYGGLTPPADAPTEQPAEPAPTEEQPSISITPAPEPQPTTIFITIIPEPSTVFLTETLPRITVTVTEPLPPPPPPSSDTIVPVTSSSSLSVISSGFQMSSTAISVTSGSLYSTPGPVTGVLPNPPPPLGTPSNSNIVTQQPVPTTIAPSSTSSSGTAPAQESALPSVTGTARTYLGLAPDAFLGVILAIVLSVIILLCCILCWIRHRRRRRRRLEAALPPTTEQTSRLLAGDRDPTREDLAYPYSTHEREYRRSQIAMMRARGELDDDWEDRLHSPSMHSASVRLPEDEVGTAYGIRERAFAAAGVYGYAPVPRAPPSTGTEGRSVGDSTQVPTITPTNVATGNEARLSPTPRKDTRSTEATNDSSALHLYAAGGRSRMDSNEATDELFYNNTSEVEAPSPMASSSDIHFLQRYSSQDAGGTAAIAAARAARRHAPSTGYASADNSREPSPDVPRTRNLEELPRAAIAYPESPVSDDQESSRLMPEGDRREAPVVVMNDTPPDHPSRQTRESSLSRWMHGSDRSTRVSQQAPILQRVLQRVMGSRLSTQPAFSIVSTSGVEPPTQQHDPPSAQREPSRMSRDFDFGNGLLFPRPPMHTVYSSGANTAKDDMRRWGGVLPSRLSSGQQSGTPVASGAFSSPDHPSGVDVSALSQMEQGDGNNHRPLGAPIMVNRDVTPQVRERTGTPASTSLLGFGLRPPPPSAFPPERRTSAVSSGRSTVYYDARSTTSTPMETLSSGRDRAASPLSRYDSPPPQPITTLRNVQSAQSFHSATSGPFLPPGLSVTADVQPDPKPVDALDMPPPMPTRDVRQVRSLNTIFSVGTAETYDTANPPLSIGRAFLQDEQTRFPPPGLDPAPRISRSVPSDIAPSEAADADLGAGTIGSTSRASSTWQRDHEFAPVEDVLEDEPPMAANQWRVLSAYPYDDSGSLRRSFHAGNQRNNSSDQSHWRLTLGQPVTIVPQEEDSPRHSQFGDLLSTQQEWPTGVGYDSQGSRNSSNRTNASHSRDIHSLRASEGVATGGSNGSKGSTKTGSSRRSVSEHGHIKYQEKSSGGVGDALLSAFGPGPSRQARGTGGTMDSVGEASSDAVSPSPRNRSFWWSDRDRSSPGQARIRTPPSAPAGSSSTPGTRLVGSGNDAGTFGQGASSAPVLPSRGWPAQGVPLDVTPADGRRPSQSHSFVHRESPVRPFAGLHSHSPGPSPSHSHSPPGGGGREISRPGTSTSHSHSHTHGTHGAETTMGTMTEATTEDDHEHEPMHDMPLSDVEHILHATSPVLGERKTIEEEHERGRIVESGGGGGEAPPSPGRWMPRWQQL